MENILEKLSSYNILNNLLPGVVFIYFWDKVFLTMKFSLSQHDIITSIFLYYFFGMILSRVGSLVIEPLFITCKIIPHYKTYPEYLEASRIDKKITELVETDNLYRTMIATFLLLFIIKLLYYSICNSDYIFYKDIILYILFILTIIFSLAYRKQTNIIIKRIINVLKTKESQ